LVLSISPQSRNQAQFAGLLGDKMHQAAKELRFEYAGRLRDEILERS